MTVEIRILGPSEGALLRRVAPGVFDQEIEPALAEEFLRDPRHHLSVAVDGGTVVGFASGVHYIHPDKPAELWINEVGVAPSHRRQGLAQQLLNRLFEHAHSLGCREGWVLTSPANLGAMHLYEAVGGRRLSDPPAMFTFKLPGGASK